MCVAIHGDSRNLTSAFLVDPSLRIQMTAKYVRFLFCADTNKTYFRKAKKLHYNQDCFFERLNFMLLLYILTFKVTEFFWFS